MSNLAARVERLETLIELAMIRTGLHVATASGTIDALGNVTINHKTATITSITADIGAPTLTVNFAPGFDSDAIYWVEGFIYVPATIAEHFLPFTQTPTQTVLTGLYPGLGPWDFAILAIGDP